ncbi:GNAT family N-acetyltransferase [Paraburkholderia kirstenboschensis]|uniref:GNAT family protein n=1 Tax=Paraburkholderia kirstenboschensis TaxID=1245436 RepID=A0ABZ0EEP9_9BURK|nr:GNAT family protein [Paraburkholderia kirstenboschensis]WOD14999.1 GNAT family protein [Paraburkholderia kirstenboschensis]
MLVRLLCKQDAPSFHSLRLCGLREAPTSFASSYEEEVDRSADVIESQLATRNDRGVFGAFEGSRLIGIAGLGRENRRKLNHKAFLWGVYVAPDMRGSGVSKTLVAEVLAFARSIPEITQVNLTVNANNPAAIHVYTSLGFEQFGRERNSLMVDGHTYDEVHMSLHFGS